MASSGTSVFELDVSDIIEEAYERLGMEVRSGYDSKTARRSLNLLLQEWSNRQVNLWKLTPTTQALTKGVPSYVLPANILDISDVVHTRVGVDLSMVRLSRDQYQARPNKLTEGRSSQYWLQRSIVPRLHVYPAPENNTDVVTYYAMERIEDVGTSTDTLDIPSRFGPSVISGLAYYLAVKKMPQKAQMMKAIYDEELNLAMAEDHERVSLFLRPGGLS